MDQEIALLEENHIWILTDLPPDQSMQLDCLAQKQSLWQGRLIAKELSQDQCTDFSTAFSPLEKMSMIH